MHTTSSRSVVSSGISERGSRGLRTSKRGAGLTAAFLLAVGAFARPASAAGTWTAAPRNNAAGGQAFGLWL